MKKKNIKAVIKLILAFSVCLMLAFFIRIGLVALKDNGCFLVKEIITNSPDSLELSYLKGRNIFAVDLRKQAKLIALNYPGCKAVRIIRIFPDKLFVDFVKRIPAACIKLSRIFYVDQDSFLFDFLSDAAVSDLPLVTGLETKIFGPKAGKRYNNVVELSAALNIIKEIKKNRALSGYRINKIDAANISSVSLFLSSGIGSRDFAFEIKIGSNNIPDKIAILGSLLNQISDRLNIKYIDLRFKEPVIKFADKEK